MFEFCSTACFAVVAQAANVAEKTAQSLDPPFYSTTWFLVLLLIAAIVIGWLLARSITASMRMNEFSGRLAMVFIITMIGGLMIWSKWPPKFGVDLRGGINMVGSLNLDAFRNTEDINEPMPTANDIIPVLIRRVNPAGTKEIMIRALGTDKIEVTIPSVNLQEADETWSNLVKAGKLQFRILASPLFHRAEIELAREQAKAGSRETLIQRDNPDGTKKTVAYWATLAREVDAAVIPGEDTIAPIKFLPQPGQLIRDKATGRIIESFEFDGCFGSNEELWGRDLAKWFKERGIRSPQILLIEPEPQMNVEGQHLARVSSGTDEKGRPCVNFVTNDEGSYRMGMFTKTNSPNSQKQFRNMGIVIDDQLHSAPTINEAIYKNGQILGSFSPEEVNQLVTNLQSGKLSVALNKEPISKDFINSTLGEELKERGIWAIVSSLLLVLVFMLFYYRFAGIVATIGLALNMLLILALVMAIDLPLTLTGLAGLVLTVGMSVDANVLIFERIREELDRGAALRMAIRNGFDKATTTIVDANVTTLITAIVLYVIGTEQIKGFSVTLFLGILMSMFTAIFVARLIFDIAERSRWLTKLNMTRMFDRQRFDFLGKVRLFITASVLLILVGLASLFILGPRVLDHDLRGGSTVRMVFNEPQKIEDIRKTLADQKMVVNGEKIEFTVSSFGTAPGEEDQKDRVFKVDSNLRAWEGEGTEEKFEQLDELLSKVFAGKLKQYHTEIKGTASSDSSSNKGSTAPDQSSNPSINPAGLKTGMHWRARPAMTFASAMVTAPTLGINGLLVQDDKPAQTEEQKTEEQKTDLDVVQPESEDESDKSAAATTIDEKANGDQAGGDFPAGESAPAEQVEYVDVTRELTVDPEISGKTLQTLIVDASKVADREIQPEDITVDSPDTLPEESPLTTLSKNWSVTMNLAQPEDADQILAVWAEGFNDKPYFPTASKVGGQIAKDTQIQAIVAMVASLLGIIAYIWIRFQNVAFGLAAVIALIHDVLIVLGAIALSHWLAGVFGFLGVIEFKISLEIVAALLTVIGYSLNDTIVVFDRIREVRGKRQEITADMINESVSQTLSRTILTSLTTFIVVFILYWFGGDAIHGFAFALCIGIIVGTYSSIFIASPALLWLMNTCGLNPGIVDPAAE